MKKKILPMFFLLSLAMGLCIAVSGCSALKLKVWIYSGSPTATASI